MKKIVAFVLLLFISGCAASQSEIKNKLAIKTPPGKARLIFERESRFMAAGVTARIKANNKEISRVSNGHTEVAFVKPGQYKLTADYWLSSGQSTFKFRAKAGRTYRFRVAVRRLDLYPGPSFVPASATTDAKGNESGGYFSIRLIGNK